LRLRKIEVGADEGWTDGEEERRQEKRGLANMEARLNSPKALIEGGRL
jgi:hypothetical protein